MNQPYEGFNLHTGAFKSTAALTSAALAGGLFLILTTTNRPLAGEAVKSAASIDTIAYSTDGNDLVNTVTGVEHPVTVGPGVRLNVSLEPGVVVNYENRLKNSAAPIAISKHGEDLGWRYVATSTGVKIEWQTLSGVGTYNILRDGVSIGSSRRNSLVDSQLATGSKHWYAIEAAKDQPSNSMNEDFTSVSFEVDLVGSVPTRSATQPTDDSAQSPGVATNQVASYRASSSEPSSTASSSTAAVAGDMLLGEFRYQTFIPDVSIAAPCTVVVGGGPFYEYYNGNNRSWGADSNSYKTRVGVQMYYRPSTHGQVVGWNKQVESTHRFLVLADSPYPPSRRDHDLPHR